MAGAERVTVSSGDSSTRVAEGPEDDEGTATRELRAIARERRRQVASSAPSAARETDDPSSITQVMRMSRDERRRARDTTDEARATAARGSWRDGVFLALVGVLFSAQFALALFREGRIGLAIVLAIAPAALLFVVGVLVGRWLSKEPS